MLRSMTAYGRFEEQNDHGTLSWEMRSVNHRYLEVSFRLPEELRAIEPLARERIGKRLKRGKVDVFLKYQPNSDIVTDLNVNEALVQQVLRAAENVRSSSEHCGAIDPMKVLGWSGVVGQRQRDDKALQDCAMNLLDPLLDDYLAAREREGAKTMDMLALRCTTIEKIITQVSALRPKVVERLSDKFKVRLSELDIEVDSARLEQELVFAMHKLDVDEELDRLRAHVGEMRNIFERDEPVGRRLDFLIQEFNREANTLGSKAADSDTTGFSVELKVLIEQMREQVQNIE